MRCEAINGSWPVQDGGRWNRQASDVKIDIYDLLGRNIGTIVDGYKSAGDHQVTWDASDVTSGVYFYKIQAGEYSETKRMTYLK